MSARSLARAVFRRLPPGWTAAVDYYCRPRLAEAAGPFNGQRARQQLYRDLARVCHFEAIVETGTFRGHTTEFLASVGMAPVYTVEAFPRYYHYARRRFRHRRDIHPSFGDSRDFIEQLAGDAILRRKKVFFYLDAHWYDDLPLHRELELIGAAWDEPVVMIDDFAVAGDEGYGFDDYGPGKRLSLEYLAGLDGGWVTFCPTTPSCQETGWRRGCLVITRGEAATQLCSLQLLRRFTHKVVDTKAAEAGSVTDRTRED